jgi:hypothetical protein
LLGHRAEIAVVDIDIPLFVGPFELYGKGSQHQENSENREEVKNRKISEA